MTWIDVANRCKNRVQIYVSPECRGQDARFELSSGTRLASQTDASDGAYEEGARIPREPWRSPNKAEKAYLVSSEPLEDMGRSISIIRLPGSFFANAGDEDVEEVERQLLASVHDVCETGSEVKCIGVVRNPHGAKTTTTVGDKRKTYLGLHIDTWQSADVERRNLSRNRITVNVGDNHRYFLFLPVSVVEIAQILADEIGPEHLPVHYPGEIGRWFMELFPEVPVIRCRLAPHEAYIAPTENLVHDGSSEGQQHGDAQFTVLGHIRPPRSMKNSRTF
jgi:hypothetical protein